MYKIVLSLAALGLTAGVAYAQTSFANVDADASGELSYAELQVAWPDLSRAEFNAADVDRSGGLSNGELATLQPAIAQAPQVVHAPVDLGPAETLTGASSKAGEIVD